MRESYADRNRLLKALGFKSYHHYLNSPIWFALRKLVLELKGGKCTLCPSRAILVHHQSYTAQTLLGLNIFPLYPLCESCHNSIEFGRDGSKLLFHHVQEKFNQLFKRVVLSQHEPILKRHMIFPRKKGRK